MYTKNSLHSSLGYRFHCKNINTEIFISGQESKFEYPVHSSQYTGVEVCIDSDLLSTLCAPKDRIEIRKFLKGEETKEHDNSYSYDFDVFIFPSGLVKTNAMINFTINSKNENGETLEIYINDILSVILT